MKLQLLLILLISSLIEYGQAHPLDADKFEIYRFEGHEKVDHVFPFADEKSIKIYSNEKNDHWQAKNLSGQMVTIVVNTRELPTFTKAIKIPAGSQTGLGLPKKKAIFVGFTEQVTRKPQAETVSFISSPFPDRKEITSSSAFSVDDRHHFRKGFLVFMCFLLLVTLPGRAIDPIR